MRFVQIHDRGHYARPGLPLQLLPQGSQEGDRARRVAADPPVEEGWRPTPEGQGASYGNCEGWTAMLIHLKAWLEHGIVLRTGYYT